MQLHIIFKLIFALASISAHCVPHNHMFVYTTVKPVLSCHSKSPNIGFQDCLSLFAGQKYCRMLQGEHSAILSTLEHSAILLTFIKLLFVFKTFVLSIFEWPLKTDFTVYEVLIAKQFIYMGS